MPRNKHALPKLLARLLKLRQFSFVAGGKWQHGSEISQRRYADYGAYLEHQKSKLGNIQDALEMKRDNDLASFERRFRSCPQLPANQRVLCLGARLGTEVEAFLNLGHFAVGIDLNPGENNPYVVTGDFHHLVFADDSVDVVYTNCLDHVFDLEALGAEVTRVLRHDGIAIVDIEAGYEEGFTPGDFEATHWATAEGFADKLAEAAGLQKIAFRVLDNTRKRHLMQAVLRKEDSALAKAKMPAAG